MHASEILQRVSAIGEARSQFLTPRHLALAALPSGVPMPANAAAKTCLPTSEVERPPLSSIGNSTPTGAFGGSGGGAKRFLKALLRFETMFMYI